MTVSRYIFTLTAPIVIGKAKVEHASSQPMKGLYLDRIFTNAPAIGMFTVKRLRVQRVTISRREFDAWEVNPMVYDEEYRPFDKRLITPGSSVDAEIVYTGQGHADLVNGKPFLFVMTLHGEER